MRDPDQEYLKESYVNFSSFRDLTLKEEVIEALAFLEDVDASRLAVEARDGVITLIGEVSSEEERVRALDCASDVQGVVTVMDSMIVM